MYFCLPLARTPSICHTGLLAACEQDQSFIPKINLKKLVHLVGFTIRILRLHPAFLTVPNQELLAAFKCVI